MKIFLFTSDQADCTTSDVGDLISTKIGRLADASTKGDIFQNFANIHAVLTAAFDQAILVGKRGLGYSIEAYATAGNRVISEINDEKSWRTFNHYLNGGGVVRKSATLHGTEEAKMEFLAVNFAHLGTNKEFVDPSLWYNMISTGGASLQIALVYDTNMRTALHNFFLAVVHASLYCNIEKIPFDWIDVFYTTWNARKKVVEVKSVFEQYKTRTRFYVTQLKFFLKANQEMDELLADRLIEPDQDQMDDIEKIKAINNENIQTLRVKLDSIYEQFEASIQTQCSGGQVNCFVGISFLGVMDSEGACYDEEKGNQGYHIIGGVDKFKILFEIYITPRDERPVHFDGRTYILKGGLLTDPENEEVAVSTLIKLDVLYEPLKALIATTQGGSRSPSNKEFLPAGNWKTGTNMADAKLLGVYVKAMNYLLGIRMAKAETQAARRTDWTFGAAWLFGSYYTCRLGADVVAVRALPQANFVLEERSIASLENMLSSFL